MWKMALQSCFIESQRRKLDVHASEILVVLLSNAVEGLLPLTADHKPTWRSEIDLLKEYRFFPFHAQFHTSMMANEDNIIVTRRWHFHAMIKLLFGKVPVFYIHWGKRSSARIKNGKTDRLIERGVKKLQLTSDLSQKMAWNPEKAGPIGPQK